MCLEVNLVIFPIQKLYIAKMLASLSLLPDKNSVALKKSALKSQMW